MVHLDEGSSTSSSPLQSFSMMAISPFSSPSLVRDLKSEERGLYLIHLLLNCATHVAAGSLEHANAFLEHISHLASPDGDAMQRIAACFTEALALRLLRSWPGLYRALHSTTTAALVNTDFALARRNFLQLFPFLRLGFLVSNQAIMEAMDGEKMVHVIDLHGEDPTQWLPLLQALASRPEGPPHLRITAVHHHKETLTLTGMRLSEEAERLDIPFQFNPVVAASLDAVNPETLRVKTGEALAISSVLQLHSLLATADNNNNSHHRGSQYRKKGTLGELLDKEAIASPDSSSSSPFFQSSARMERFLASLWGLSPKIMVVMEQESNHNGLTLNERFMDSLNFYAALFDCLESTVSRQSAERTRVEKMMFGEEIKNIIACEGAERRERHEKLERWVQRFELAGFGRLPLSYFGMMQAKRLLQGFGCEGYKVKEDNGCFLICWQDRPLFSVSAWRCRRLSASTAHHTNA